MKEENLKNKVVNATKWSSITEIAVRVVSPITSMILARILNPDAFGVVATVTMFFSFADMLTDVGFQKYLVQHDFKDKDEKYKNANVAFWTNFGVSVFLWAAISLFCEPIATMAGNPGLGKVIAISCVQLPITSFSSIQMALYKRNFEFRSLFIVRIVSAIIPFVVTIPLALAGLNYWALIIGTIMGQVSSAVILTIRSEWKPAAYFNMKILKEMLAFSLWSLFESISIWFSAWADTLIIGSTMTPYHLGLYKTSLNMVNALISIVAAAVIPVLFSTLSRLQDDEVSFRNTFYKVQGLVAYFLFPMGLGLYLYSDVATQIMLGGKWMEASSIIGIWALTSVVKVVFSDFNSECYRAKGKPRLSFSLQVLHLAFLIPTLVIASRYDFTTLVYARAFIRFQLVASSLFAMQAVLHIPVKKMFQGVFKPVVFTAVMGLVAVALRSMFNNMTWNIMSIIMCILVYGAMTVFFAKEEFSWMLGKVCKNKKLSMKR